MTLDPRTPVLVGVGSISNPPREGDGPAADPSGRPEAAQLMIEATRQALADSGRPAIVGRVGLVAAMASMTPYRDPARLVAEAVGASAARTVVAEPGILQQEVISGCIGAVVEGETEVALLVAGEAKYRAQQAGFAGIAVADTVQSDEIEPDERVTAAGMVIHQCEIEAGLVQAVHHYAMIENAMAADRGLSAEQVNREVATLWARFNEIAVSNPAAWSRDRVTAEQIATPGPHNRVLATPYAKLHNSQWNVDQAAAFIFTTAGVADELGVGRDRWVFPLGAAQSNNMVPVVERAEVGRCEGFAVVGDALAEATGVAAAAVDHIELYSCFPVAVRAQIAELGIDPQRDLTVTGGMTFAGGPFNHFVLQALATLAEVLRSDSDSTGLITSVSGMLTKQAAALWSTRPPPDRPRFVDVSDAVSAATGVCPVQPGFSGTAEVVTSTVVWDRSGPQMAVAVVQTPSGGRMVATSDTDAALEAFGAGTLIGASVEVAAASPSSARAELLVGS